MKVNKKVLLSASKYLIKTSHRYYIKSLFYPVVTIMFLLGSCSGSHQEKNLKAKMYIEILEKEALKIVDPKAEIKIIAEGFHWTEGPLWIESEKSLLFSDIPSNSVYKMNLAGDTSLYLYPAGYTASAYKDQEPGSNGLLISPEGKLVLLQHGDRRIAYMNNSFAKPGPDYITIVDNYKGNKLNSPNDGVYDSEGNLYFSDPPYGLPGGDNDPAKELSFQGVFCQLKSGELVLLDSLSRPNGLALSPGESKLIVAVSDEKHAVWYSYDIAEAGRVQNKKLFFDVTHLIGKEGQKGLPDGMKMHPGEYLFATGPGGVWVFNKAAKPIARIHTGHATSNCAFTSDYKTLFLTADDYILSVELK